MSTRRDVILGILGAASAVSVTAAAGGAAAAATGPAPAAFLAFSKTLLGTTELDAGMSDDILSAFIDVGQGEALASLMAQTEPIGPGNTMANDVVAAWYSGMSTRTSGDVVTSFNDALMWNAMSFTKAWANCGGATGYWSDPPAG